jgi:magnesium-transporting ATPase (P-type)
VKPLLPKLYYVGQKSTIFNIPNYLMWIMVGVCHALVIFLVPYFIYLGTVIQSNGETGDMWAFSISSFTAIIIVTLIRINIDLLRLSTLSSWIR